MGKVQVEKLSPVKEQENKEIEYGFEKGEIQFLTLIAEIIVEIIMEDNHEEQ